MEHEIRPFGQPLGIGLQLGAQGAGLGPRLPGLQDLAGLVGSLQAGDGARMTMQSQAELAWRSTLDANVVAAALLYLKTGWAWLDPALSLVIALVSPNSREGKSHLAASLAIAFAQLNLKTLLIDANLRKPAQHQFFDLGNKTGLSTMLAGRTLPTLDLSHTITQHLNVITAGPKPPNPSEILSQPALSELLDKFRPDVKVIIIDSPPTRVGPDAQIIAPQAGNVIMVCRKDETSIAALHKAYRDMETTSVRILGSFFNTVPEPVGMSVGKLRRWLGRLGRRSDQE